MGNFLHWSTETLVSDDGSQFRDTFVEISEIHDVERQDLEQNNTVHIESDKDTMNQ